MQIFDRLKPGDANGDVDQADSPGPPERVGDHYRDVETGSLQQALLDGSRGGVGIFGQHGCEMFTGDVGAVHAGIGADEPVAGF